MELEFAKPVFSLPAMGCPPINWFCKPSSRILAWMLFLTLPTSVKMLPCDTKGAKASKLRLLASTGAHKKINSHCPIFDNGAGLLADATMDYPLSGDVYRLMDNVQSKTICSEFDEQLDISEAL